MFIHLQPKQCIILYVIIFKGEYQAVVVLLFMFLHGYYWNDLLNSITFIRFLNISELLGISQLVIVIF